jgi:hypothetical protein
MSEAPVRLYRGERLGAPRLNLVRKSRLAEGAPGRGGALRVISFLSGSFMADVQYDRVVGIAGRLCAR